MMDKKDLKHFFQNFHFRKIRQNTQDNEQLDLKHESIINKGVTETLETRMNLRMNTD